MHVADFGQHDTTDLPVVVDSVVGLMSPPPQFHRRLTLPPNWKKARLTKGLNHLGALPSLPPNWEKAYIALIEENRGCANCFSAGTNNL